MLPTVFTRSVAVSSLLIAGCVVGETGPGTEGDDDGRPPQDPGSDPGPGPNPSPTQKD